VWPRVGEMASNQELWQGALDYWRKKVTDKTAYLTELNGGAAPRWAHGGTCPDMDTIRNAEIDQVQREIELLKNTIRKYEVKTRA
jgi:hypothetical protein